MPLNYRLRLPSGHISSTMPAPRRCHREGVHERTRGNDRGAPEFGGDILVGARDQRGLAFEILSIPFGARIHHDGLRRRRHRGACTTSGTTSRPKGIPLSHGNVLWKIFAAYVDLGLTTQDRTLMAGPMYHAGAFDLPGMGSFYVGGSLVIMRTFEAAALMFAYRPEDRRTFGWLPRCSTPCFSFPTSTVLTPASVRFITNGGERCPSTSSRRYYDLPQRVAGRLLRAH